MRCVKRHASQSLSESVTPVSSAPSCEYKRHLSWCLSLRDMTFLLFQLLQTLVQVAEAGSIQKVSGPFIEGHQSAVTFIVAVHLARKSVYCSFLLTAAAVIPLAQTGQFSECNCLVTPNHHVCLCHPLMSTFLLSCHFCSMSGWVNSVYSAPWEGSNDHTTSWYTVYPGQFLHCCDCKWGWADQSSNWSSM